MKFVRVNDKDRPWEARAAGNTTRGENDVLRDDQVFGRDTPPANDLVMSGALPVPDVEMEDSQTTGVEGEATSQDANMEDAIPPTPVPPNTASHGRPSHLPVMAFELSTKPPVFPPKRKRRGIPQPAPSTPPKISRKRLKSYRRGDLLKDEMPRSLY